MTEQEAGNTRTNGKVPVRANVDNAGLGDQNHRLQNSYLIFHLEKQAMNHVAL